MRALTVLSLVVAIAGPARADVTAAARAFSEGQAAQLEGNYELAAQHFELANSMIPSKEALRSAARARLLANQLARAATHAETLLARYGDDPPSSKLANDILKDARPRLGRLRVACEAPCTLAVDGRALVTAAAETHVVYVNPGRQVLEVGFEGGASATRPVTPRAGDDIVVDVKRPPVPRPKSPAAAPAPVAAAPRAEPTESRGLPRTVFIVGAGVTVALGGLAIWSGLDTLSAHDDYVAHPTQQGWDDGRSKQLRTNLLLAGTAAAGVTTALIGVFWTNWHPDAPTVAVSPSGDGLTFALTGRF